jgi:hypothetical protein
MVLDPPAPVRSTIVRFLAEYNPFYLLSACCMLFGVFAMNDSLDWSPIPLHQLLTMIVTLNVYEAMLIGLAGFLLRRGITRDAVILLIIEAFFLADVGFLNMEVVSRDPHVGLIVNAFALAAAVCKVTLVFRAAGIPLADGRFAFVLTQIAALFAVPGVFAIVATDRGQYLPMSAVYVGWWLCGLLPIAYALFVRRADIFRRPLGPNSIGVDVILTRVMLVLPMLSLIAHLCLANWVYKTQFHVLNFGPLLIGLAVAIGHADASVAPLLWRIRMMLALPFLAIALSAIRFPNELVWQPIGLGVSPLRIALVAAALVYLDGLLLHRLPSFAWAAGACLSFATLGHSVPTINNNSVELAKSSASTVNRLIPRTLFAWGMLSTAASFVLLGLGAIVSMLRKEEGPIVETDTK